METKKCLKKNHLSLSYLTKEIFQIPKYLSLNDDLCKFILDLGRLHKKLIINL